MVHQVEEGSINSVFSPGAGECLLVVQLSEEVCPEAAQPEVAQ